MPFAEEDLTSKIIRCVIKVHQVLGPGFLESIYRKALVLELRQIGLCVEFEKEVSVWYLDQVVGKHRLDVLIEKKIVVELKNVECLHPKYYAQVKSYLRAAECHIGLLINFASQKAEFKRIEI